jgi:hypothetical protein
MIIVKQQVAVHQIISHPGVHKVIGAIVCLKPNKMVKDDQQSKGTEQKEFNIGLKKLFHVLIRSNLIADPHLQSWLKSRLELLKEPHIVFEE